MSDINVTAGPKSLYEKLLQQHLVTEVDGELLLYIDRHLIHEVTSPQAFSGLAIKQRPVFSPDKTVATMDHSVSTRSLALDASGSESYQQLQTLAMNCEQHGIELYPLGHERQGIVHVMAPEMGLILPGMTVVCGDSHTATHGAFGALAFGIGSSQVEEVLATQCLRISPQKSMLINVSGKRPEGITAKDIILYIINQIGTDGGNGYVIEYAGEVIEAMSMEERMTVCNMSIEAGARAGLIAPDATTFEYLQGRDYAPEGELWQQALSAWQQLHSDKDAAFSARIDIDISQIAPQITWGTNPAQSVGVNDPVPAPSDFAFTSAQDSAHKALSYTKLEAGTHMSDVAVDAVFIGSCTNSRIEDLRLAAKFAKGGQVAKTVTAIVVPGSNAVRKQAEAEGLDQVFTAAGFQWRMPGCSMCLGMNDDKLSEGQRCASTSNRNFEGRQGRGAITHLVSPAMAAAAALHGHFVDIRNLKQAS